MIMSRCAQAIENIFPAVPGPVHVHNQQISGSRVGIGTKIIDDSQNFLAGTVNGVFSWEVLHFPAPGTP
ncbi:MAG TPA: hypothetical protein VNY05_44630 [Candidatus Acidoferrales bacterium]|jgi:hypothetical protein|nr:hypothetical protein [Candidatus Acidoferrales bacterium]